ncbi:transport permease protein [Lactococcus hodotermopsidis]|uniref:Transport permease protein n=1 Tax=Pseudolactococcus hodotermopsidis TaxID=2709157 RepID=A0A6A0B9X3_9LACT|nr:ABC transporter permease [Lactococcus hodotermopsidis]GFH42250.1 transport permease protein [Lactococcus hodotermopsidis]
MKNVFRYIREQIRYFPLIARMTKYDTKNNYTSYTLGRIWQYANPIILAAIYYFIFGYVFKRDFGATEAPFLPWLLVGMAVWGITNGTVLSSLNSILSQLNLSTALKFPVSISPTITFFSGIFEFFIMMVIAIGISFAKGYQPTIYWLQFIYYTLALVIFTLAYSLLNATITTLFRDYSQIVRSVGRMGMMISGVMMNFQSNTVPSYIRKFILLNPFAYLIEGFRDAVFSKDWFYHKSTSGLFFWAFTIAVLVLGTHLFYRYEESFRDYL